MIRLSDGRYLMQLRDQRPDIWYPGCWGCFGGALDGREDPLEGLRRELREELELQVSEARQVARMDFDFGPVGLGRASRIYYLVELDAALVPRLALHEGQRLEAMAYSRLLSGIPVVPYDAFALHLVHSRLAV